MKLTIVRDGATFQFSKDQVVTAGRNIDSDLVFESDEVSRTHLKFTYENGEWVLTHLSENNPTFVDGKSVTRVVLPKKCEVVLSLPNSNNRMQVTLTEYKSQSGRPAQAKDSSNAGQAKSSEDGQPPRPTDTPGPTNPTSPKLGSRTSLGTFTQEFRPSTKRIRIGRSDGNDVILADDLTVSSEHAEIVTDNGIFWEIVDRNSRNGTFVDGHRISKTPISSRSRITIGRSTFQFVDGSLRVFERQGQLTFGAANLTVLAPSGKEKGKVLLDDVTFKLPERCVLGVLGPSGSGKSTLVRALAGFKFADKGNVSINGEDLYENYDAWRARIGYVPQDDILHLSLPVERALRYGAELRFDDTDGSAVVEKRIDEVLRQLRLSEHRKKPISALSGGQRKRVSVALELLSKPDVIFLDEPTSGLDPGNEKSLMQELRALADDPSQGRTIVVITHSVQSLDLCDRLLILSKGGGLAFFGRPQEALQFFGATDYADVFDRLEKTDKRTSQENFRASPLFAEHVGYPTPTTRGESRSGRPMAQRSSFGQFLTLTKRYVDVIVSDRKSMYGLLIQAPAIALVLALLSKRGLHINGGDLWNSKALLSLLSLVLAASFLGASNASREIVKERAVVRRERSFGLSIPAYLGSKVLVLGFLTVVQSFVLVFIGTAAADGPIDSVTGLPGKLELAIVISLAGIAAMALGLFMSSVVKNADRAAAILPLLLLVMYLFSGGPTDPHNLRGIGELSYLNSAKWGLSAAATSADLQELHRCKEVIDSEGRIIGRMSAPMRGLLDKAKLDNTPADEMPPKVEHDDQCKNLWARDSSHLMADVIALLTMSSIFLVVSGFMLRRLKD